MRLLNFIRNSFERVLAVDTEYRSDITNTIPNKVLCFVYIDVFTGETFRYWEHEKNYSERHFNYDECLLISYNSVAEFGSYLARMHGRPLNMYDAMVETARLYKPMRMQKGQMKLLSTAEYYGIKDKMTETEKEENLDRILRRNKFSDLPFKYSLDEQKEILKYCEADTELLRQVFIKQVQDIESKCNLKTDDDCRDELWRIMNRGYAQGCCALVERNGVPIDYPLVKKFNDNWVFVKDNLIREVNKDLDVFTDDLKLSFEKFDRLIINENLSDRWPRMKTGHFTTNKNVIKKYLKNEKINKFNIIRQFQNMTKLTAYTPGTDGRVRYSANMFGTVTGRASPSSAKNPFAASKWARNFIKPSLGNILVYMDYASQEPAIMGYLSQDKKLIEAYKSGDLYIHSMKLFGKLDDNATEETHPKERKIGKILFLANVYGQGPKAVASQLNCTVAHAKFLQKKWRDIYSVYCNWSDGIIEAGLNKGYLSTVNGWQRHIKDLFKIKDGKKVDIRRSLMNWPIQSHGAEILRKALQDLTDEQFEVCALVHDAILIQIPIADFNSRLDEAKRIMVNASIEIVGGPIRVEHEVIRSNFKQYGKDGKENKDQELFNRIMEEINTYTRSVSNLHPNQEHRPI